MNSFGKVVEMIVTIICFFILPLQYTLMKQDSLSQTYVSNQTAYLVDSVRNVGFLSHKMYDTYEKNLQRTGNTYHIEMAHYEYRQILKTEEYSSQYTGIYTSEIKKNLYQGSGTYQFHQGDYFSVSVRKRNPSLFENFRSMLLHIPKNNMQMIVTYGGAIRDEME